MAPSLAIIEVRKVRPRAIQTESQEKYVHKFGRSKQPRRPFKDTTQGGPFATMPRGPIKGFGT